MNARYESRDNNIARASVSVCAREGSSSIASARGHVVKYSRALMPGAGIVRGSSLPRLYFFACSPNVVTVPALFFTTFGKHFARDREAAVIGSRASAPRTRRSAAVSGGGGGNFR